MPDNPNLSDKSVAALRSQQQSVFDGVDVVGLLKSSTDILVVTKVVGTDEIAGKASDTRVGVPPKSGGFLDRLTGSPEGLQEIQRVLRNLEGTEQVTLRRTGNSVHVSLQLPHEQCVPHFRRQGIAQAFDINLGRALCGNVSERPDGGFTITDVQGASSSVFGPLRQRGTAYVSSIDISADGAIHSTSNYIDRRPAFNQKVHEYTQNPGLVEKLSRGHQLFEIAKNAAAVDVKKATGNKFDITISEPVKRSIEINKVIGMQTVKSIDLQAQVSIRASADETGIHLTDIKGAQIKAVVFGQHLTLDLRTINLESDGNGGTVMKLQVSLPMAPGQTMDFTVPSRKKP